jgi:hypothetical protein
MNSYILSIIKNIKSYSLSFELRRERLTAVIKENLREIQMYRIPNHAPATKNLSDPPTAFKKVSLSPSLATRNSADSCGRTAMIADLPERGTP